MFRQFVSARTHRATTCLFAYVCLFICMQSINQKSKIKINQINMFNDETFTKLLSAPKDVSDRDTNEMKDVFDGQMWKDFLMILRIITL